MLRLFQFIAFSGLLMVVYSDCINDPIACIKTGTAYATPLALLNWDKTIKTLNEKCTIGKKYFECMEKFMKECNIPPPPFNPIPEQKKFRESLCTEGSDMQKKYLINAKCLDGKGVGMYADCGNPAAQESNASVDPNKQKELICIGYKAIPCLKGKIESACGADAKSVFEGITNPEMPMWKDLCGGACGLASFAWVLAAGLLFLANFYST